MTEAALAPARIPGSAPWRRGAGVGVAGASELLRRGVLVLAVGALAWSAPPRVVAGVPPGPTAATAVAPRPAAAESGTAWPDLAPGQQAFLRPLQRDWPTIDASQKRKWMALTSHVPSMSADERSRVQARMTEWVKLTPQQRGQARLRYQEALQLPPTDRQARWEAYQSLTPERRQQLAERAAHAASVPGSSPRRWAPAASSTSAREQPQAKSNIVAPPGAEAQRRQIGPTLLQARPGATTTLISRPPGPPPHLQTGAPKIAATPEYVNRSTLLPRHGPQAATAAPSATGPARTMTAPSAPPALPTPASTPDAPLDATSGPAGGVRR